MSMLENIKGAIFDMDGTLIDSMWIWSKIDVDYLTKRNIPVPPNLKDDIEHLSFYETAKYFKEKFNISDSIERIMDDWNNMAYTEYVNNVTLKPYAKQFLDILKKLNIKIALATSNCTLLLEAALKTLNIYDYFDVIVTTDEVERGKAFPDVYLLAAERLNLKPSECIVFEDILPAVKGAKSAGMTVVGVHDKYSENQKDGILKHADKYILGYKELGDVV